MPYMLSDYEGMRKNFSRLKAMHTKHFPVFKQDYNVIKKDFLSIATLYMAVKSM